MLAPVSALLAVFIAFFSGASCASRQVPPHGEPVRVGRMQDNELHLREIPLERYVAGVLEKEVHESWPPEALKAQAVAARTYALYRKRKPRDAQFDVMADTSDQVFGSDEGHAESIVRAVLETEGETLAYDGKIFQTFFHSCCGGKSERANNIWPGDFPAPLLELHDDPYCSACPPARWEHRIDRSEIQSVEIAERDTSGRVKTVRISPASGKPRVLPGIAFRQLQGNTSLKSTLFDVIAEGDDIVFEGRGAGHGVGLCQWGAKAMAEQGKSYRDILGFYYPGAEIVPLSRDAEARPSTEEQIIQDLEKSE